MATTPEQCLDALREAADRLGESPTKAQYEALELTPSTTTILRVVGSWNEAKRLAELETYTRAESGGTPVQPKPDGVVIPDDWTWEELTPQQRWYYKNREHRIERKEARRRSIQRWLTTYKRDNCECDRCGEGHPATLDFHHVGGKTMDVSQMANHGYSEERIRAEIEECVVVCANCHRKEHDRESSPTPADADSTGSRKRRRVWITERKRASDGCVRCGETDPVCLDFHHVGAKAMGIAEMVSRKRPRDDIRRELEKCEHLCANCHRKEHHSGSGTSAD